LFQLRENLDFIYLPKTAPNTMLIIAIMYVMSHKTAKIILRNQTSLTFLSMLFLYRTITTNRTGPKNNPTINRMRASVNSSALSYFVLASDMISRLV